MNQNYQVNSPDVVAEVVDGEAVIVNLRNGNYYSLDGVGAQIWALLAEQRSVDQVVATIQRDYAGDVAEIEQCIVRLVEELRSEQLLVLVDGASAPNMPTSAAQADGMHPAFAPPMLNKYTDMEDLLLVDPVHGNVIHVERDPKHN
jgi:hypothetical protein